MTIRSNLFGGSALVSLMLALPLQAAELNISLKSVESSTGTIRVAIYNNAETFRGSPFRALSIPATVGDMEIQVEDLPEGKYAVMLFQDTNGNEELDSNLFGLPTEPWGGSLGGKAVFGPPDWNATCFEVPETGTEISINLR